MWICLFYKRLGKAYLFNDVIIVKNLILNFYNEVITVEQCTVK